MRACHTSRAARGRPKISRVPPRPPYALVAPEFPLRALAARAGRAPLGGAREAALATMMAARLALGATGAHPLPGGVRSERAAAARGWFASLALPATLRTPFARVAECSARDDRAALLDAFVAVIEVVQPQLDPASRSELREVARSLET